MSDDELEDMLDDCDGLDCDNCGQPITTADETLCDECRESVRAAVAKIEREGRASMAADDECDRRA